MGKMLTNISQWMIVLHTSTWIYRINSISKILMRLIEHPTFLSIFQKSCSVFIFSVSVVLSKLDMSAVELNIVVGVGVIVDGLLLLLSWLT